MSLVTDFQRDDEAALRDVLAIHFPHKIPPPMHAMLRHEFIVAVLREGGVAAEVAAGSVVFFNGYTLHRSLDNRRRTGLRRALVNPVMSARCELPWSFGGSRFAQHDYRDIEMVCGEDALAGRGFEDPARPCLRPCNP
jgi:hypothetical protein